MKKKCDKTFYYVGDYYDNFNIRVVHVCAEDRKRYYFDNWARYDSILKDRTPSGYYECDSMEEAKQRRHSCILHAIEVCNASIKSRTVERNKWLEELQRDSGNNGLIKHGC